MFAQILAWIEECVFAVMKTPHKYTVICSRNCRTSIDFSNVGPEFLESSASRRVIYFDRLKYLNILAHVDERI